ncbi:MAG: hypothetical protein MPK06_03140, partial [Alphaproteobacteria bacterium]|nr:hypothetical protein [Alphaproteobacteria bacterium]
LTPEIAPQEVQKGQKHGAINEVLGTNFNFLRASPHPSAGIARLSQHCDCLSSTPANAKCGASPVS